MITNLSFNNYKTFKNTVNVSFIANQKIKRFKCNTIKDNNTSILKSIGVYGPNNTGKTCLLLAIANLKSLMLNLPHEDLTNSFSNNDVISYDVKYYINNRHYEYQLDYDCKNHIYLNEKLMLLTICDSNPHMYSSKTIIERSINNSKKKIIENNIFDPSFPIVIAKRFDDNTEQSIAKQDYIKFANSIVLVRLDGGIDISRTVKLLESDPKALNFISKFVSNSDLHIDKLEYKDNVTFDVNVNNYLDNYKLPKETLKFISSHNGYKVPSFIFDSIGTRKIIQLAGYIYSAIKNKEILLIDEIDSSLHHILTRSIVSMFNNSLNNNAQLVFATHDILLMDLVNLLRKDQIYLTDIVKGESIVKSLMDFPSQSINGIRGDENILNHYMKGSFGAIPTPDLLSTIIK